jgi:hypothetical protein
MGKTLVLKVVWGIYDKKDKVLDTYEKNSRTVLSSDRKLVFLVYKGGITSPPAWNYAVLPNGRKLSLGNNKVDLKELKVQIQEGYFDTKQKKIIKKSSLKNVEVLKSHNGRENVYVSGVQRPELIPTEFVEIETRKGKELISLYSKKK